MEPQVTSRLSDDVRARVTGLIDEATGADGTPPLSEQFLLNLRAPTERHDLRHVVSGGPDSVDGYAQLDAGYAEVVVHPRARGKGVGGALVETLESLTRPDDVAGAPRVWAHGDLPAAARLAERRRYRRDRVLWQMRRPLPAVGGGPSDAAGDPLPDVTLPDGVTLRSFVTGRDEDEFLRVNNAAFDWHPEQGGWTHREFDERAAESWFDPSGFLLALDRDGRQLGYHWTKVHPASTERSAGGASIRTAAPAIGEVYVLGVDPAAHGRGLGRVLTLAGLHHLRDRGLGAVLLYVEADNGPAVRVYERLGFTVHAADVNYVR